MRPFSESISTGNNLNLHHESDNHLSDLMMWRAWKKPEEILKIPVEHRTYIQKRLIETDPVKIKKQLSYANSKSLNLGPYIKDG